MHRCTECGTVGRRDFIRLSFGAALASRFGLAWGQDGAPRRAKSVILLWMQGAASQFETWDPKPGTPNGGPTKTIDTGRGYSVAEGLARTAKLADRFSVIRTLNSKDANHETAQYLMHTGHRRIDSVDYPHLGSLIASELGGLPQGLPGCVVFGGADSSAAGYLPPDQAPFVFEKPDHPLEDLELAPGVTTWRLEDRERLLRAQNEAFRRDHDERKVAEHQKAGDRALALIRSPHLKAFDIAREPDDVRLLYGDPPFSRACLLARRLVQAGVRFVEVRLGDWDTHSDNFARTRALTSQLDPGLSALLTDLDRQSMLQETLVIWATEFGRTPRINANSGRDHFARAWSVMLAGGGIAGGRVIGRTSPDGMEISDRPVAVEDLFATVYDRLGVDWTRKMTTPEGRPVAILEKGAPIKELL